jgi:hypothetical protein
MPQLDVEGPRPQGRWTVLLRWLLAVPHFVILVFYGIAAFFVTIVGWFAALFTGRLPDGIGYFLAGFLAYETRVFSYATLLVGEYPPFELGVHAPGYPVSIELYKTPLNRLAVLFRLILAIPAAIVAGVVTSGWYVVAFFIWLVTLVLGRQPDPLFQATAAMERFVMRFHAYWTMLTASYPKRLFGDEGMPVADRLSPTRPLYLSSAAKALVVLFIVLGAIAEIFSNAENSNGWDNSSLRVRPAQAAAGPVSAPAGSFGSDAALSSARPGTGA